MDGGRDAASLCQTAVRRLIHLFNWQLLSEEEFVIRAMETLDKNPAMTPMQACLNVYSKKLHDASQDVSQQEQAYYELHYFLYRKACCRKSDLADDATQESLRLIFEQIDTCRNPGAFLRFAEWKLWQAIKRLDPSDRPVLPPLPPEPSTGTLALFDEKAEALWRCIRQIWETHPRARNQLKAVLWKYIEEFSDEEIGVRLNKTSAQIHVLRSRGLKKLRRCMAEQGYTTNHRPSGN